jgi:RNA polymerase sigma-70 factor, ECF subfamily
LVAREIPSAEHRPRPDPGATSTGLLNQVRAGDAVAWGRLVELYGPVIYGWSRQAGMSADDAGDLVQDVFRELVEHFGGFRRDRPGDTFRGWLFAITRNKIRDYYRRHRSQAAAEGGTAAQERLRQVPQQPAEGPAEAGCESALELRALELVRGQFEARTWQAFWRLAIDGRPGAEVAEELGMSLPAVYQAKYRVLERVRQDFGDLLR